MDGQFPWQSICTILRRRFRYDCGWWRHLDTALRALSAYRMRTKAIHVSIRLLLSPHV